MKQRTEDRRESLQQSIRQMMGHTDLPEDVFIGAIEDALRSIALRHYGSESKVSVDINLANEEIKCHVPKKVVNIMQDFSTEIPIEVAQKLDPDAKIGDMIDVEISPDEFGRIQAQLGRQILLGKLREAERELIYSEFEGREGEIIVGYLQRYDGPNAIIDLERTDVLRTEALLPASQIPLHHRYTRGDSLRCLILEVKDTMTGEQIVVSRTHPDLIARLFEHEVPEVYDGQVRVLNVVRDPGFRAKVAVTATEDGIDALGTCVGVRGARVQTIVRELKNEKIDIIEWSEDPRTYISNALNLKPAEIRRVELNEEEKIANVIVIDDKLSLAIGRRGQNARLAAKLTEWHIDIKSDSEAPVTLETLFKGDSNETEDAAETEDTSDNPDETSTDNGDETATEDVIETLSEDTAETAETEDTSDNPEEMSTDNGDETATEDLIETLSENTNDSDIETEPESEENI